MATTILRLPKYHGLENDFLIYDLRHGGRELSREETIRILNRRIGVGADGILALHPSSKAAARMVVHNADGSIAEMCGNGIRCAAKYLVDLAAEGTATATARCPPRIDIDTGAGILGCLITYGPDGRAEQVEVEMGRAHLVAPNLPATPDGQPFVDLPLPGQSTGVRGTAVSMGNPHLVLSAAALEEVERLGPALEHHPSFPHGANVEFVQPHPDGQGLRVNVWERGSGFTRACGTGACAAVAAWVHRGLLPADAWVPVDLPGGRLHIHVSADLSQVRMRGPAVYVFDAHVHVPLPNGA